MLAKLAYVGWLWVSLSPHLQIHVQPALTFSSYKPCPPLSVSSLSKHLNFFHFHSLGLDKFNNYFNGILAWGMETKWFVTFFSS